MKKFFVLILFFISLSVSGQQLSDTTRIFLTTQGADGIWVYYPSKGDNPKPIPETLIGIGFQDLVIVDHVIYLTTQRPNGIWRYEIGSGKRPTQISSTAGYGFRSVIAAGNRLYLTTQATDGVFTYDIGSDNPPKQIPNTAGLEFRDLVRIDNLDIYLTMQAADGGIWKMEIDTDDIQRPKREPNTIGSRFESMTANYYLTTQGPYGIYTYNAVTHSSTLVENTNGLGFRDLIQIQDEIFLTTQGAGGIWKLRMDSGQKPMRLPNTAGAGFRSLVVYY